MPPKFKFTKEEIINNALAIVREGGASALTARALGERLGASSKPIFGQFQSMEELQREVMNAANALYEEYLKTDMSEGRYPPYKASGMAYIRFASEERELFKLLFMRDRTGEEIPDGREELKPIIDIIVKNLGICEEDAYMLHLQMWIYVHGIATMIATSYLNWDTEFVSHSLTDAYQGFKHRYISK